MILLPDRQGAVSWNQDWDIQLVFGRSCGWLLHQLTTPCSAWGSLSPPLLTARLLPNCSEDRSHETLRWWEMCSHQREKQHTSVYQCTRTPPLAMPADMNLWQAAKCSKISSSSELNLRCKVMFATFHRGAYCSSPSNNSYDTSIIDGDFFIGKFL